MRKWIKALKVVTALLLFCLVSAATAALMTYRAMKRTQMAVHLELLHTIELLELSVTENARVLSDLQSRVGDMQRVADVRRSSGLPPLLKAPNGSNPVAQLQPKAPSGLAASTKLDNSSTAW